MRSGWKAMCSIESQVTIWLTGLPHWSMVRYPATCSASITVKYATVSGIAGGLPRRSVATVATPPNATMPVEAASEKHMARLHPFRIAAFRPAPRL